MSSSPERPAFGLGTTALGGMFQQMSASEAQTLLHAAHARGIRWFDTAPMYGSSTAERRLGHFLDELGGGEGVTVSTKVGRVMIPQRRAEAAGPQNEFGWRNAGPFVEAFDYSYDGIMRSAEDSLARIGVDAFDVLFLHDIGRDTHGEDNDRRVADLRAGGYRAMTELKEAGVARELGVGVNETAALRSTLTEIDLDRALLANQYTLLTQPEDESLFTECADAGVKLVAGGIYNSGVLAGGDHFVYGDVPAEISRKVAALAACCESHDVPLMTAALQFVLRSGRFDHVMLGVRSVSELDSTFAAADAEIPEAVWDDLAERGLLDARWLPARQSGTSS